MANPGVSEHTKARQPKFESRPHEIDEKLEDEEHPQEFPCVSRRPGTLRRELRTRDWQFRLFYLRLRQKLGAALEAMQCQLFVLAAAIMATFHGEPPEIVSENDSKCD